MSDLVLNRCEQLCKALEANYRKDSPDSSGVYTYTIEPASKYYKIWMNSTWSGRTSRSIHAFVNKITGEVFKPASIRGPAKHVRFDMLNDESFTRMLSICDWSGSYLYLR